MRNHKTAILVGLLLLSISLNGMATDLTIKVKRHYLNFPISQKVDRKTMHLTVNGREECRFVIRLTDGTPDYWVFQDVSMYKGKKLTLSFDGSDAALQKIIQADTIVGGAAMYQEAGRPQYHFTTRRGWINDPNGLVYDNGVYHLFYQHNPYEREWENMHWGHAVSSDLIHWNELPDALHPDTIGTMFSGSAVVDYDNTAGFNQKGHPAIIAYYTADRPEYERQCMAYSTDGGQTFTKYAGNPVIDSHAKWQTHDTRDPAVFWYAPGKHWVMVLNERDGHTIYNSTDLKHWTATSHITGFWECPGLFELPADGNSHDAHWVLWGASGTYMVGQFDGKTFTPETGKLCNMNGTGYAAQIFNNLPQNDRRVIKMIWGHMDFGDVPFNGCMLLPQEQTLHRTAAGLRLYSYPVKEIAQLFTPAYSAHDLTLDQANEAMKAFRDNDELHIRARLHLTYSTDAGLRYRGQHLLSYDLNGNRLNGDFYATEQPGSMDLTADIYIDRGIVEVFVDGGAYSYSLKRVPHAGSQEGYTFYGNQVQVKSLEVSTAQSIWR